MGQWLGDQVGGGAQQTAPFLVGWERAFTFCPWRYSANGEVGVVGVFTSDVGYSCELSSGVVSRRVGVVPQGQSLARHLMASAGCLIRLSSFNAMLLIFSSAVVNGFGVCNTGSLSIVASLVRVPNMGGITYVVNKHSCVIIGGTSRDHRRCSAQAPSSSSSSSFKHRLGS